MGSLCHEVAKLQADRAQMEELLAQVSHKFCRPLRLSAEFVNEIALNMQRHHVCTASAPIS